MEKDKKTTDILEKKKPIQYKPIPGVADTEAFVCDTETGICGPVNKEKEKK